MTTTLIIFTTGAIVLILAVRSAMKYRNKGESKVNVYEHSSTFKKPDIEMVNNVSQKQDDSGKTTDISSIQTKDDKNNTTGN